MVQQLAPDPPWPTDSASTRFALNYRERGREAKLQQISRLRETERLRSEGQR